MKKRKLISLALCGALLCGTFAGCSNGNGESSTNTTSASKKSEATITEPKILTTAVGAELNTLYPLNMDVQNNIGTKLCYEGLVNYEDGKVVPGLAESWEFSNEGKALTFHLKEGVTFHDGTPFNGEAVKADFEFAHSNPNFSNISAVANLESVEIVDEYTLTFHYPNAYFAYLMDFCYPETMVLVSPKVLEEGNYQLMKDVVGTGPYIYDEIVDGEYVRFIRNENYWGEQPYYDEVIVKYIPEASARLQALQNGEIDLIYGSALLSWDDYDQAITLSNIEGAVAKSDSKARNLVVNASGVLSNVNMRSAVAYGIDKKTLSNGLTYGKETPADHLFPDDVPYTDVELNVVRTYNLDKANALLEQEGWIMNESTGIREKDGQPLILKYTYHSADALNKPLATAIKSQLAIIGIGVQTEGQEMMTWWQEGVAGNYDLIMWNTEQPYTAPHNYFIPMLSRSPHVPSLKNIEDSDEFIALINAFQVNDDPIQIQGIFNQLLNFDNDNVLDLPILFAKDMIVYNSEKIDGYDFTSTPTFFDVRKIRPIE
ncbi:nickel ABC transporter substrate-binding protein [Niameybacter massiliensis]|uniref:Nickel ABC transporter substrate-binding protein n=1 Tax=Holtiella tumoricola TaxID=3018743 RepID=A0AA42DSR9_9FIRM|nr:nickel ABC transporter substrate-binding protein [Holtiella tumoricola]MDA3734047.1 nickel ABC transporter substrate-binding protein [Holtiella tumoricola]